ncbi:hypothetical protein GTY64_03630 [Streptomyces sp. SID8376]|uniref:hypothetical protein n=1 Tax=unclassified Streptomyces TaxID=2593676 RepID=UPI000380300A|nr:hypothetical protein [Streptomyces sp. SID8376]
MSRTTITAAAGDTSGRPARPVRFADPERNRAYWERVKRNASSAPPLTTDQIATLRGIFLSAAREAA